MGWPIREPSTIYAIRCIENGKVYIGRTKDLERRVREHLYELRRGLKNCGGRDDHGFQHDYDKYGESAFEVYVLESCVLPSDVEKRESFWIREYRATNPRYGYNISDGIAARPKVLPIRKGKPPMCCD